jgi:glutathione reductase (NADPH)
MGRLGEITVDEVSQTSAPNVYAIGDVTNRNNLTPVAIREGHAFADTVFGGRPTPVDHSAVPTAVFSEPEVGAVGLTLMKLVVDGHSDRVVGCHIVGPDAGEMIQLVAVAVKMKATKADFDATMALHPTAAEELVTMREKAASHVREAAE